MNMLILYSYHCCHILLKWFSYKNLSFGDVLFKYDCQQFGYDVLTGCFLCSFSV